MIKSRAKINEIETNKMIQRINEKKRLANMTKWRRGKTQINKIKMRKGT
jgi:hypothetical protein